MPCSALPGLVELKDGAHLLHELTGPTPGRQPPGSATGLRYHQLTHLAAHESDSLSLTRSTLVAAALARNLSITQHGCLQPPSKHPLEAVVHRDNDLAAQPTSNSRPASRRGTHGPASRRNRPYARATNVSR